MNLILKQIFDRHLRNRHNSSLAKGALLFTGLFIIGLTVLALGYQIYSSPWKELITDTSLWVKILILLTWSGLSLVGELLGEVCRTIEVTDLINEIENEEAKEAIKTNDMQDPKKSDEC